MWENSYGEKQILKFHLMTTELFYRSFPVLRKSRAKLAEYFGLTFSFMTYSVTTYKYTFCYSAFSIYWTGHGHSGPRKLKSKSCSSGIRKGFEGKRKLLCIQCSLSLPCKKCWVLEVTTLPETSE